MTRSAEDLRLDDLAFKVSNMMDGWDLKDVARICAALCGYAIADMPEENRDKARTELTAFMVRCSKEKITWLTRH